jgi:hypothetical protein
MTRRYCFFMLLHATPQWRALDRHARDAHHDALLARVFDGYPEVRVRRFESTAFDGRCSELLLWETEDVAQYVHAVETLREAGLLGAPWFETLDVIPAVEDAWREHDDALEPAMCLP